jgi:hypothetical protein
MACLPFVSPVANEGGGGMTSKINLEAKRRNPGSPGVDIRWIPHL